VRNLASGAAVMASSTRRSGRARATEDGTDETDFERLRDGHPLSSAGLEYEGVSSDDEEEYEEDEEEDETRGAPMLLQTPSGGAMRPGEYAASVSSSRNGRKRADPDATKPLTVPEFVAQLHVEDLKRRFSKTRWAMEVTAGKPAKLVIGDPATLDEASTRTLKEFAAAHRTAAQFRAAKRSYENRLRDESRQLATRALPFAKAAAAQSEDAKGMPVTLQDASGTAEHVVQAVPERHGGAAPSMGAALDCIVAATTAVLQRLAPALVETRVTRANMLQVMKTIFDERVGPALMESIEKAIKEYQKATTTYTETVKLVKREDLEKSRKRRVGTARKALGAAAFGNAGQAAAVE